MFNKINLQYVISYFGLIPYIIILIDKLFFFKIENRIAQEFILYYSLLIIVFIGSINWNLLTNVSNYKILYGFFPSFYSVILIVLNLYDYNISLLFFSLNIFLIIQLFFDYILIFKESDNKNPFYSLRLPLTILIFVILIILQ